MVGKRSFPFGKNLFSGVNSLASFQGRTLEYSWILISFWLYRYFVDWIENHTFLICIYIPASSSSGAVWTLRDGVVRHPKHHPWNAPLWIHLRSLGSVSSPNRCLVDMTHDLKKSITLPETNITFAPEMVVKPSSESPRFQGSIFRGGLLLLVFREGKSFEMQCSGKLAWNKIPNLSRISEEKFRKILHILLDSLTSWHRRELVTHWGYFLVGGWTNPFEKYESKWKSSPNRGENKKWLKPASSFDLPRFWSFFTTHCWSPVAMKPIRWLFFATYLKHMLARQIGSFFQLGVEIKKMFQTTTYSYLINIPLFTRLYTYQVVQDFFHQQ